MFVCKTGSESLILFSTVRFETGLGRLSSDKKSNKKKAIKKTNLYIKKNNLFIKKLHSDINGIDYNYWLISPCM